jgi:hypothetical protein
MLALAIDGAPTCNACRRSGEGVFVLISMTTTRRSVTSLAHLWYVPGVILLIWAIFVTWKTVCVVIDTHSTSLQGDEFHVLARYVALRDGALSALGFFWEQHNEHRVALARIFFLADILVDRGTQALTKTITLLFCAATAGFFSLLVIRFDRLHWGIRLGTIGLFIALFMSSHQMENLYRGFNNQVLTVTFFSVVALYLTARSIESGRSLPLWSAVASGVLATYSMSNGLAVWPLMLLLCLVLRAKLRSTATIAVVGAIVIVSFLWNYHKPAAHPSMFAGLADPLGFAHYFVAFLAGPLNGFNLSQATVVGGGALLLVLYYLLRQLKAGGRVPTLAWFLIATCFLVMAIDAMVAIGRFGFGVEQGLSSRYSSYVAPLYAALLLLGLSRVDATQKSPMQSLDLAVLGGTALVCVIGLMPSQSRPIIDWASGQFALYEQLGAAAITEAPDEAFLQTVASPRQIEADFPYLAEHQLSMFRSESSTQLRRAIREKAAITGVMNPEGNWCAGFIDEIVPNAAGSAWLRVGGWAIDKGTEGPADGIAFTDRAGQVIGVARFVSTRPDVERALNLKRSGLPLHFVGYAKTRELIRGYAYREGDGCLFAEKPAP